MMLITEKLQVFAEELAYIWSAVPHNKKYLEFLKIIEDIKELEKRVLVLEDRFRNGIKYDKKQNIYILVWTKREIKKARKEAKKLVKELNWK